MCKRIFVLAVIVTIFSSIKAQDWTGNSLKLTTPSGPANGVTLEMEPVVTWNWKKDFSIAHQSAGTPGKLFGIGANATGPLLNYGYIGGASPTSIYLDNPWMIFKPDGNVGIGVLDPTQKFEVNGRVKLHETTDGTGVWMSNATVGSWFTGLTNTGAWRVYNDNIGNTFTINPDGNVGIGTSSPIEKLEVNGGLKLGAAANDTEGTISYEAGSFFITDATGKSALGATGGIGSNVVLGDENGQSGNLVLHDYQRGGYSGSYPTGFSSWNRAFTVKDGSSGHELSIGTHADGHFYIGKNSDNLDERAKSLAVNIPLIGSNEVRIGQAIGDNGVIKNGSLEYREGEFYGYLVDDVASKLLTENSVGYVGVGTANPTSTLHVVGDQAQILLEDNVLPQGNANYGSVSIRFKGNDAIADYGSDYSIGTVYTPGGLSSYFNITNNQGGSGMYFSTNDRLLFGKLSDWTSYVNAQQINSKYLFSGQGYFSGGLMVGTAIDTEKKAGTIEFNGGEFYVYKEDGVATSLNLNENYISKSEEEQLIINKTGSIAGGTVVEGKMGVGTTNINPNYQLSVGGGVICEKVQVALQGSSEWPDYVFSDNYNLSSLKELKVYIKDKGHLPNVPSADEVKKQGVDLLEMNRILLEKLEELTLHAINQGEELEELKKQMKEFSEMNTLLK